MTRKKEHTALIYAYLGSYEDVADSIFIISNKDIDTEIKEVLDTSHGFYMNEVLEDQDAESLAKIKTALIKLGTMLSDDSENTYEEDDGTKYLDLLGRLLPYKLTEIEKEKPIDKIITRLIISGICM